MNQNGSNQYYTWLLIQEQPNKLMRKTFEEWKYQGEVDMVARVPVFLGCKQNQSFLYTTDSGKFMDEIYQNKKTRAFSFASFSELQQLHEKVFYGPGNRLFKVLWDGAINTHEAALDPYFRRFITLQYLGPGQQKNLDNKESTFFEEKELGFDTNSGNDCLPRLVLRPERITLSKDCFDRVFLHEGKPLKQQELNSIMLPPVRNSSPSNTYYDGMQVQLRNQLRSFIAKYSSTSEPAIVILWNLMNDPLIRDILLDGGSIMLEAKKNCSTSLLLNFFYNKQETELTQTNWFRKTIFLESEQFISQQWAQPLGGLLLDDLYQAANQRIHFRETGDKISWETTSISSSGSGARNGTWKLFNTIKENLKRNSDKATFDDLVTFPSAARTNSSPDNEMAEKLFCMHFFRCPWEERLGYDWKNAMLIIVSEIAKQQYLTYTDRIDDWAQVNKEHSLTIENQETGALKISYSPFVKNEDQMHWRLLLPLGTIFSPRAAMKLNQPTARLDEGFHLAN